MYLPNNSENQLSRNINIIHKQIVTPEDAIGTENGFDYQRLIKDFGVEEISLELQAKFKDITGHDVHYLIRRGIFFSHVERDKILNAHKSGKQIYIYTGR